MTGRLLLNGLAGAVVVGRDVEERGGVGARGALESQMNARLPVFDGRKPGAKTRALTQVPVVMASGAVVARRGLGRLRGVQGVADFGAGRGVGQSEPGPRRRVAEVMTPRSVDRRAAGRRA